MNKREINGASLEIIELWSKIDV